MCNVADVNVKSREKELLMAAAAAAAAASVQLRVDDEYRATESFGW